MVPEGESSYPSLNSRNEGEKWTGARRLSIDRIISGGHPPSSLTGRLGPSSPSNEMLNPHFYTFFFWGGLLFLIGGFIVSKGNRIWYLGFMISGGAGMAIAYIYGMICLYKCWAVLQGFTARTTPGKAVGFLWIPIYNLYWMFVAVRGLAKDANLFLSQRKITTHPINADLSLAVCILIFIPYVGFINIVLFNILIYQWAGFYNFVMAHRGTLLQVHGAGENKG